MISLSIFIVSAGQLHHAVSTSPRKSSEWYISDPYKLFHRQRIKASFLISVIRARISSFNSTQKKYFRWGLSDQT